LFPPAFAHWNFRCSQKNYRLPHFHYTWQNVIMKNSNLRKLWARVLLGIGVVAMVVGALDPLEGSVIILPGCGFVALGTWLGESPRPLARYWLWLFGLMALGVAAMFGLSAVGGLGGKHGHSWWWGFFLLPYPIAWILGIANLVSRLVASVRHRHAS
jgi:hypothetical protein